MTQDEQKTAGAADAQAEAAPAGTTASPAEDETGAALDEVVLKLQAQAQEFREGWQRERAEFANYKRRTERDMREAYQNASSDVLKALLPVLDDFERAFGSLPADLKDNPWADGVGGIQRKLLKVLEQFNVTTIDPTGQPFDPEQHEAISTDAESDAPSGTVTVTLAKGYKAGDRVLRPALVRVAQ